MIKSKTALLALLAVFAYATYSHADDVMLTDVVANLSDGTTFTATAAHGTFTGNDVGSGSPLLGYLNNGGTADLADYVNDATFTSTGMFSTDGDDQFGNTAFGLAVDPSADWVFRGKSDDASTPYTNNPMGATGTLMLSNFYGDHEYMVVSLKGGNLGWAAYGFDFSGLAEGVTVTGFDYDTRALGGFGLSHSSLMSVPEPASLVLFGTVVGIAAVRRRRM